jgi:glycyl-tRNA synthetase beta chain/uncharacterized protein
MEQHIADLLVHPKVVETRDHIHHNIPKHDHLLRSVKYSYRFARWLSADQRVCTRAALIHDIDSRYGTLTNHGAIAARWAADQGECDEVCSAIVSHMYPLGGPAPTTREGWVLALADKAATLGDMKQFMRGLLDGSSIATFRRLRQTDPFEQSRIEQPGKRRLALRRIRRRVFDA